MKKILYAILILGCAAGNASALTTLEETTNPAYHGNSTTVQGDDVRRTMEKNAEKANDNFDELALTKENKAVVQASAPADTTVDWYDTDQEAGVLILKRHNGTTWARASSHGVQYQSSCASITAGMCVDTDDGKLYYHNGTAVVEVGSGGSYTLPTATGSVLGGVKVGSRLSITDGVLSADVQTTDISGKENSLGNPSANGYVLSSTTSGVRSWVEMPGGGTGIAHAASDGNYYASKDGGWASLSGVFAAPLGADDNYVTDAEKSVWNAKQDTLVSGTNIKSVNGLSLLGSGDLPITGSPSWMPSVAPTNGRQILQAIGGCSNTAYDTQATCQANSSTWTTPTYQHTSIISGLINDTGTADDDLWSAAKITSELAGKQATLGFIPENTANKGAANGYAGLGSDGKVPSSQLPTLGTTYSVPSLADAQSGTSTTAYVWSPQRVAQAIAALAPSGSAGEGYYEIDGGSSASATFTGDIDGGASI